MQPASAIPSAPVTTALTGTQYDPMKPQGDSASWWQKLLPTAGAVLGGLVPIPGLDIATAGLGAAAGKALENATTGKKVLQGDVLSSAAMGGAGQLGGNILGGILGKAMGGTANLAEKGANATFAGQFGKGVMDKDLAAYLQEANGIADKNAVGKLAKIYTGSADAPEGQALINKTVENGVNTLSPNRINTTDLVMRPAKAGQQAMAASAAEQQGNMLQHFMSTNGLNPTEQKAVMTNVSAIADGLPKSIAGETDPISALKFQRGVAGLADKAQTAYIKSGYTDVNAKNLMSTYDQLSKEMVDRIGFNNIQVPQDVKDQLTKDILTHAGAINPKSAATVAKEVQDAQTLGDLRGVQAKWVAGNRALQTSENIAANNYGLTAGELAQAGLPIAGAVAGGGKGLVGGLAGAAVSSPTVSKAGTDILSKLSDVTGSKNAQGIVKQLARVGAITAATSPNLASTPTQPMMPSGNINSAIPGQGAGMQAQPESEFNNIMQSLIQAMMLDPNQFAGAGSNIVGAAMPQLIKTASAQAQLPGLLANLANAGGPQGLGGAFSRFTGLIPGTPQAALNAQSGQIANNLGVTPSLVPNVMQTPQTAGIQSGTLQSIIQALGGGLPSAVPAQ